MTPKSCVLLLCATAAAISTGCTAIHPIEIETNPPGAEIFVTRTDHGNEQYVGTTEPEKPLRYQLVSPLAEKVWPWPVKIEARMEGRMSDSKEFQRSDQLPKRVRLVLHKFDDI